LKQSLKNVKTNRGIDRPRRPKSIDVINSNKKSGVTVPLKTEELFTTARFDILFLFELYELVNKM
jgi:hypothetical protein